MIANYHTHSVRCKHATGTETEYVRCAIDAGLQILGFSDHTPYPFPGDYVSSFRMPVEQLADYADSVRAVQKQYAGQIQIHLGVEAEYYPKYFPDMVQLLRDNGVEYMILGQHLLGNEIDTLREGFPTGDESKLEQFCDQAIEAMHTGLFTYFAHPDLFHFEGDKKVYQLHMRRVCKASRECGIPLELNLLGLYVGRHYPHPDFFEVAAEEGCQVILGKDAHQPQFLLDQEIVAQGLSILHRFGLEPLDTVPLRHI